MLQYGRPKSWTYRARNNKIRLRIEITAEHIITVTLQSFQALSLQKIMTLTPKYYNTQLNREWNTNWWRIIAKQKQQNYLQCSTPKSSKSCHQTHSQVIYCRKTKPHPKVLICVPKSSSQTSHHKLPKSLSIYPPSYSPTTRRSDWTWPMRPPWYDLPVCTSMCNSVSVNPTIKYDP